MSLIEPIKNVSKLDYYTWKVGAIVLLLALLAVLGTRNGVFGTTQYQDEVNDVYWHMGYSQCVDYFNLSSDEMYVLNLYRMEKIIQEQNDTQRD